MSTKKTNAAGGLAAFLQVPNATREVMLARAEHELRSGALDEAAETLSALCVLWPLDRTIHALAAEIHQATGRGDLRALHMDLAERLAAGGYHG